MILQETNNINTKLALLASCLGEFSRVCKDVKMNDNEGRAMFSEK